MDMRVYLDGRVCTQDDQYQCMATCKNGKPCGKKTRYMYRPKNTFMCWTHISVEEKARQQPVDEDEDEFIWNW